MRTGDRCLTGDRCVTGNRILSGRWGKFLLTGLIGFLAQVAALWLLISLTPLHYSVATVLAVEIAIVLNFVCHERWTWRDRPAANGRERWARLARFNAMTALTSLVGSVAITMIASPPTTAVK